jgi:hypothetical protein
VLRAKLGRQPDHDVKPLVVGDPAVGLQALERGIVDATPLTLPLPLMAAKMGFRELVNYGALGITFPANTVTTKAASSAVFIGNSCFLMKNIYHRERHRGRRENWR